MMGKIWAGMVALSLICAVIFGRSNELGSAAAAGTKSAVDLCLSIGGMILLWSGVMEIMRRSGLMEKLSKAISPLLGLLFPGAKKDSGVMQDISANVSANLLGLGNAATPAGIRAARGLHSPGGGTASDDLCMLVIINTASLQIIPSTVGAIRASCGAANPFDILPAVWGASAVALAVGISCARLFSRVWGDGRCR